MFEKSILNYMSNLIGSDSETELMCEKYGPTPPAICFTFANIKPDGTFATELVAHADTQITMHDAVKHMLETSIETGKIIVFHNASFDLGIIINEWPDLIPLVFKCLDQELIHCTIIREKFLNLAEFGAIKEMHTKHGALIRFGYKLDACVKKYLHKDISESKDAEDSWRKNYVLLKDKPANEWPSEAIEYAEMDSVYVLPIWAYQEQKAAELEKANGVHPFSSQKIRTCIAFAMNIMGSVGMYVDTEQSIMLDAFLTEDLAPEKLNKMFDAEKGMVDLGILVPGREPYPNKRGTLEHKEECHGHKSNPAFKKGKTVKGCGCPVKMNKAVPESISTKALEDYMLKLDAQGIVKVRRGEPTEKMKDKAALQGKEAIGNIKTDNAWFDEFAECDPVLQQYQYRQKEGKIRSDYIKKLVDPDGHATNIIRACFDPLKRSGRISSYGGENYPSWNCQNVDPRIRTVCYAPEGWLLLSSDYNAMELGTAAQTCINTVGYSVMGDVINSGGDVHAYLGSRIAYETNDEFRQYCSENKIKSQDQIYEFFLSLKKNPEFKDFFKKYRKFAKPTGLGYPGGLGPETFITYAKQTFGVVVDLETATKLREIWRNLFPEFPEYHKYISTHCEDFRLGPVEYVDKKTGKIRMMKKYKYVTPMGMMRPGCDFTKIANGMCMQSPSSEGSLIGGYEILREAINPDEGSILYGNLAPIAPVHDEYLSYVRNNDQLQEVIARKEEIMIKNMEIITPDVKAGVESALMHRWYKAAEPVYDDAGDLIPWVPEEHGYEVWLDNKLKMKTGE